MDRPIRGYRMDFESGGGAKRKFTASVSEALAGLKLAHERDHVPPYSTFESCPWDVCMVGAYLERLEAAVDACIAEIDREWGDDHYGAQAKDALVPLKETRNTRGPVGYRKALVHRGKLPAAWANTPASVAPWAAGGMAGASPSRPAHGAGPTRRTEPASWPAGTPIT